MSRKINATENIRIERIWSMPNKNTFEIVPIKSLLAEEVDLSKFWIDPFANRNKLASVTNDLCLDYDTDYHLDALDFLKMFDDSSVDGVLYDPPYSPRQVSECYNDVGYSVTWDTTKAGGYQFWVVGNRTVKNELLLTDKIISELAEQYGMVSVYTIDRNIPNKVMPARNSPTNVTGATNSTMTMEHIVVLRKE